MTASRINIAVERIETALARIEQAAARDDVATTEPSGESDIAIAGVLEDLDRLIERLEA